MKSNILPSQLVATGLWDGLACLKKKNSDCREFCAGIPISSYSEPLGPALTKIERNQMINSVLRALGGAGLGLLAGLCMATLTREPLNLRLRGYWEPSYQPLFSA